MKQQIIVSGTGGQGVLFLTRILAEAALEKGLPVLTSETHGMAMRGGTVVSQIKVGPFHSPLIRTGQADVGFFLDPSNVEVHRLFLKDGGALFVNTAGKGDYLNLDATAAAGRLGSPVSANLVLLGYAVGRQGLFAGSGVFEKVIRKVSREGYLDLNLKSFHLGLEEGSR